MTARDRQKMGAVADWLASLSLVGWVGGHAALGAFAARIAFRDLPRSMAAPTMTTIFHSFDGLIVSAMIVLAITVPLRLAAFGVEARVDQIALGAAVALLAVGCFEIFYVHPQIEAMFGAGRTLEPAFGSLHKMSERCSHLELLLTMTLLGAQSWSRFRA